MLPRWVPLWEPAQGDTTADTAQSCREDWQQQIERFTSSAARDALWISRGEFAIRAEMDRRLNSRSPNPVPKPLSQPA